MSIIIERMQLTPEVAQEFLSRNYDKNRTVRKSVVERYADAIKRGFWCDEAAGMIVFAEDGSMIDGQHRCLAVIEADKPITAYVKRGVHVDTFNYFDQGDSRKATDYIDLPNRNEVACLAKMICVLNNGDSVSAAVRSIRKVTNREIAECVEARQEDILLVVRNSRRIRESLKRGALSSISLFLYINRLAFCPEFVDLFVDELINTTSIEMEKAKSALRLGLVDKGRDKLWLLGSLQQLFIGFITNKIPKSLNKQSKFLADFEQQASELVTLGKL